MPRILVFFPCELATFLSAQTQLNFSCQIYSSAYFVLTLAYIVRTLLGHQNYVIVVFNFE
jgi:hypothetical protein